MKQVIMMSTGIVVVILTSLIILTMQGSRIRKTKLDNGVTELMEEYMETSYSDLELKNMSDASFTTWFKENLKERISEEGEFDIVIKNRDMKSGILSMEVKETYHHIIGTKGELVSERTVIKEEEKTPPIQEIGFYISKEMAKEYRIPTLVMKYAFPVGTKINCPAAPNVLGMKFLYWKEEGTDQIFQPYELEDMKVGADKRTFVAVYE